MIRKYIWEIDKPKFKTKKIIDLFSMLEWCEKSRLGLTDRIWCYIRNCYDRVDNNKVMKINLNPNQLYQPSQEIIEDCKFIVSEFPEIIEKNVLFLISW